MATINGKLLVLSVGGTVVAGRISAGIDFENDMIEITTADNTDGYKTYLPGERGATIQVDGLYDPAASEGALDAFDALDAGTQVAFIYGQTGSGETQFTGNGYISSLSINGDKNDAAAYSYTIQVSGTVTKATV